MSQPKLNKEQKSQLLRDLLNLDMRLEEIVDKYPIKADSIYSFARVMGIDMGLRGRIIRLKSEARRLEERIRIDSERFHFTIDITEI